MDKRKYKQMLLDKLYAPYAQCQCCPLAYLGRTHVVFGEGNPDAELMFLGEGPGHEEDVQARPFVGRSGQLLTRVLEAVGIAREDVFITNIVKCRPPNNRQPLPYESSTCIKILLRSQIKIIQPRIICTLGGAAVQALLEKDIKITRVRGQHLCFDNILLIPTYHPAYILRNQKEFSFFAHDLQMIASLLVSKGNN